MRATSALACASVTPGFSRASAWNPKLMPRGALASSGSGSTMRGRVRRNVNDAGSTPITSAGRAIDHERLADDVLGAAEAALPIAIGQDHAQRTARRIVFGAEDPAERRAARAAAAASMR